MTNGLKQRAANSKQRCVLHVDEFNSRAAQKLAPMISGREIFVGRDENDAAQIAAHASSCQFSESLVRTCWRAEQVGNGRTVKSLLHRTGGEGLCAA
jgi:hypothetical protein